MKILAAHFKDNQALFFGKCGCTLLGAMIIINRTGGEHGDKEEIFLYLLTDDMGQGTEQLMAVKSYIYTELLPGVMPQVKISWVRVDGGSGLNDEVMRECQLFWGWKWEQYLRSQSRWAFLGGGVGFILHLWAPRRAPKNCVE